MERQIEDLNEKGSGVENQRPSSNQSAQQLAIQDTTVSRGVRQQEPLGEEQTTAAYQHPYCQIQGMLDDARVMLWQAGKARSKRGRDNTLKTTVNYIKRIITLLPYFPVPMGDGRKWYHIASPRGEGNISLATVSIYLSQAVDAIRQGDNNSAVGLVDKSRELLADLIETEMQMVGGASK